MGRLETKPFDAASYINESEDVLELLNDAFASNHAAYIAAALGVAARSVGMTKLAAETGVNRQALYAALSEDGNPTLETLVKVLSGLGFKLKCEAKTSEAV